MELEISNTSAVSLRSSASRPSVPRNVVCELEFVAASTRNDPWAEIELDVEFTDPDGVARSVPAFWAGGRSWRVRYSSALEGLHRYRTLVRAADETGLENLSGDLTVTAYLGRNPLLLHGAPTVAPDSRHLAHADGTPFFWLADSWWSALTARFRWPETFQALADDRSMKGFTVVQLVAGLVPEFGLFSPLMASEGGQPWHERGRGPINPAFYNVPDLKISYLVGAGLAPCIVGGWGSWAQLMGRAKIMQHWRYIVARYSAFPVVWCIAGEVDWPFHFAAVDGEVPQPPHFADDDVPVEEMAAQAELWEDTSRYIATIDPFHRVRTVHPSTASAWSSTEAFKSRDSFELDMLQTGHTGYSCVPETMKHLHASLAHRDKPVLNGECTYEGIFGSNWQDVQRFLFWSHILSGTAGHTYGTMPISTFSSGADPYLPPSRASESTWEEAVHWAGATHVGIGRKILERFRWWELEPSPDAITPHAAPTNWFNPYAAMLPDETLIIYLPHDPHSVRWPGADRTPTRLMNLRPGAKYHATYVNPRTGSETDAGHFRPANTTQDLRGLLPGTGNLTKPTLEDWLLVVRVDGPFRSTSDRAWQ